MKKFLLLTAAAALAGSALATPVSTKKAAEGGKQWVINVGLFKPTGDHEDAGVDSGFTGSIDYFFGSNGEGTSSWYAGLGGFSGDGDNSLESRTYGVHVGVLFNLGKPGEDNPWSLDLRGGWYETRIEAEVPVEKAGIFGTTESVSEKDSGFGGSIAIVYRSKSGPRFSLGWYTMPEVKSFDNTGYFFTIGFPLGGK